MDYTDLARKWAKCLAFARCGNMKDASQWAQSLVDSLRAAGVEIR